MAAENENVPMVVDGDGADEDYIADVTTEALNEALEEGDYPSAAEMAAFVALVTPRGDLPQPTISLMPPPAAPSRAVSPGASNNAGSISLMPVASSSRVVAGVLKWRILYASRLR